MRHPAFVRITHWIHAACFLALLVSGLEIVVSHPRFYWGEAGNSRSAPLFIIPIPSSRSTVPTGYKFVLPDQNGWSRYLHFQTAWVLVFTGAVYLGLGLWRGHFGRRLFSGELYNPLQRRTYSLVVFLLLPLTIWTGLALSPALASAIPFAVNVFGGRQSARTLHFFLTCALSVFLIGHVFMVLRTRTPILMNRRPAA